MSTQDANTKGGSLDSGTSHKESFHSTPVSGLGQGHVGPNQKPEGGFDRPKMEGNKPQANPSTKASKGHTIK